jgi:hypothetical protein
MMHPRYTSPWKLPLLALGLVLLTGCESAGTGGADLSMVGEPPIFDDQSSSPEDLMSMEGGAGGSAADLAAALAPPRRRVAPARAPRAPVRTAARVFETSPAPDTYFATTTPVGAAGSPAHAGGAPLKDATTTRPDVLAMNRCRTLVTFEVHRQRKGLRAESRWKSICDVVGDLPYARQKVMITRMVAAL